MVRIKKKKFITITCFVLFLVFSNWALLERLSETGTFSLRPVVSHSVATALETPPLNTDKEFLYLVQTESCLPAYLAEPNLLGNSSACKCDVLVLSYKVVCEQGAKLQHIQYVYGPNTTWTSGRNVLFRLSRTRNATYRYYIFVDDDIRLQYNPYAAKPVTNQPELRTFENFLLEIEPAVGCVNYVTHRPATYIRTIRQHCLNKPDLSLLPMVHFDPILNAFHRDAYSHLLPYPEDYDQECWWHPHRFVTIGIEVKFRGQAVMYPGITILNLSHRSYPRQNHKEVEVLKIGIAIIDAKVQ